MNYQNVQIVELKNEIDETAGKFGWCVMCRKGAFSYCKDTRVPVCSKECKFKHLELMNQVSVQLENFADSKAYIDDARELLDMLGQLSVREPANPQLVQFSSRCKALSLELIYQAIGEGGTILESSCVEVVRTTILEAILKNSLSQEKQLFILTLNIFVQLVWYFRDSLKDQLV